MAEKLFTEFQPISTPQWEEVINKDLKGADYEKKLVWKTMEGFAVRPYYRAEDLQNIKHLNNNPGEFPFVRGTKQDNNWLIRQTYCAWDSFSEANKLAINGISRGVEAVGFYIDGNKAISTDKMATLLAGIDLNKVEINFQGCQCETAQIIASFLEYTKTQGYSKESIKASFDFDPHKTLVSKGNFCCEEYLQTAVKAIELTADYPSVKVIGVNGYVFNHSGSTIVQEVAFALASGSEYLSSLTEKGVDINKVASKTRFTLSVGSNYFMEIAKFRAIRMLWATITKEYGASDVDAQKIDTLAVTSQWNMTVYDAYVNMLRGTTEAMSAALAGVNSLEVLPFDYAYNHPTDFSNRIARNTQILLKEESYFNKITDAAAGSYYIEQLTVSIAEQAWNLFKDVESKGGYIAALKSDFIQNLVKESSNKRDHNFATRKETILGTNQYPNFNEVAHKEVTKEIVTRKEITKTSEMIVTPLSVYRGAQAFEELRFKTEQSGKTPTAFMLTYGNLAFCRARAQFSSNFFAVAGFKVVDNNRFATIEEGVEAALKNGAEIIVACSSDEEYEQSVVKIKELIADKAILVVAGEPACKQDLISAGVENFISVKSNVLETLKQYQTLLGIK